MKNDTHSDPLRSTSCHKKSNPVAHTRQKDSDPLHHQTDISAGLQSCMQAQRHQSTVRRKIDLVSMAARVGCSIEEIMASGIVRADGTIGREEAQRVMGALQAGSSQRITPELSHKTEELTAKTSPLQKSVEQPHTQRKSTSSEEPERKKDRSSNQSRLNGAHTFNAQKVYASKSTNSAPRKSSISPIDRLRPYSGSLHSSNLTITEETSKQYLRDATALYEAYQKDRRLKPITGTLDSSVDWDSFIPWLLARRDHRRWQKSTWRKYRSAVLYWASLQPETEYANRDKRVIDSIWHDLYYDFIDEQEPLSAKQKKSNRGPSKKRRFFDREDALAIIDFLMHESRSKYAETLVHWIRAGLYTGLRPIEWRATKIIKTMTCSPEKSLF